MVRTALMNRGLERCSSRFKRPNLAIRVNYNSAERWLPHRRDQQWQDSTGVPGQSFSPELLQARARMEVEQVFEGKQRHTQGGRQKEGVFIVWDLTHHSWIHDPKKQDVPNSMDTVDMDKIVGMWRRLFVQLSGSGAIHRKVWTRTKQKIDKIESSLLLQPRTLERDFLHIKLHTYGGQHTFRRDKKRGNIGSGTKHSVKRKRT